MNNGLNQSIVSIMEQRHRLKKNKKSQKRRSKKNKFKVKARKQIMAKICNKNKKRTNY